MQQRIAGALFGVVLSLAACGGGGPGGGLTPPAPGTPSGSAQATLQLIVPLAAPAAAGARRKPAFVSAATQAASVSTGASAAVVDLSSGSSACTTQPQGRVCALRLTVPYGPVTFTVVTYDQAPQGGAIPASAHVLGRGSVTQTIAPNSGPVAIAIDAVVDGYGSLPSFTSWPADGTTHTYGFVVNPVDFDNDPITNGANDPYANPIAVALVEQGGSGHAHLVFDGSASGTSATLTQSSDTLAVQYDGGGSPGYYATVTFGAAGISSMATTLAPLFVSSSSPAFANLHVALSGPASSVNFTIAQAQATGMPYTTAPANCTNIAAATQPSLQGGVETFAVTGGPQASSSGCVIGVSDGTSVVDIGVTNAVATPSASPSPTPVATATPSASPTASPSASPTASPSPTPVATATPVPTPTPLVTPAPLPTSIYVSNGFVWDTFPLAAAQGAGGSYNAAPATVLSLSSTSTSTSYFALDATHNLIWLSGGRAYPASWNGAAPSPVITLSGGGSGGIAVDASGNVYQNVSSFPNDDIAIYPYGSTTPGTTIQLPVSVQNAVSIALDASGNIYLSDNGANAVDVVANPGPHAGTVAGSVTRTLSGMFTKNWGLCLDGSGRIYVVDTNGPSGKVDIFAAGTTNAASSTAVETIGSTAFGGTPQFCDVDASGNLWVTDIFDLREFTAAQIATNIGGTTSSAATIVGGTLTTLGSATGIYVR